MTDTQQNAPAPTDMASIGARAVPEFDGIHDVRDPRWLQILPSTELAPWKRFWPVVPTFAHGGIEYGTIVGRRR